MKMKNIILALCVIIISVGLCMGIYLLISDGDVLGKYEASEPFTEGNPEEIDLKVSDQMNISKPAAQPTANAVDYKKRIPVIPEAKGKKGTKDNPFIVLEIVPNKALQTLSYMAGGSEPYDPIDLMTKLKKDDVLDWQGNPKAVDQVFGQFQLLSSSQYDAYNPAAKSMRKSSVVSIVPIYDLETSAQSVDDPFFVNQKVDERAIKDKDKWVRKDLPGKFTEQRKVSGYILSTENGKGEIMAKEGAKTLEDDTDWANGDWLFYEDLAELKRKNPSARPVPPADQANLIGTFWKYNAGNGPGYYYEIKDWNLTVKNVRRYRYLYYGLKNNDVLEHNLFKFDSEAEYDNFHMQVIVVTPDEINEMLKYDDENTLEYIERADMFYISDFAKNVDSQVSDQLFKFYYTYILGETTRPNFTSLLGYGGNDMEWEECMKIVKRLSEDINLPMILNTKKSEEYRTQVYLYTDHNNAAQSRTDTNSSITNAEKIFYIIAPFNLQLQKGINYDGKRTFMDDIYPKLKQIKLRKPNGTAKYTGFYERPTHNSIPANERQRSYYIWGKYTFYPSPDEVLMNASSIYENQYGYNKNFNFDNDNHTFQGRDPKNDEDRQNVVGFQDNQSAGNPDIFNRVSAAAYEILNQKVAGKIEPALPLEIDIKKAFQSGSNYLYYVDMNAKANYKDDKVIKLTFHVTNPNNLAGTLGVIAKNPDTGEEFPLKVTNTETGEVFDGASNDTVLVPECHSPSVPTTTKFVLEYPVKLWKMKNGTHFTQIIFSGQVRSVYDNPRTGAATYTDYESTEAIVDLLERTLFDLD